ncbi:GAF and ANTAR domain-containing protein [Streptomyces sp. NBC_01304]|uniref:GAF and ANTAR domain-containing protein n=1 Tax=Streptomyces sp. NBC_01304 TaxID=2903818 RepID=UPI002E1178F9|nr:GAF and ANTAR domain-containing protein [Streptomyces sp. NBC_01304]
MDSQGQDEALSLADMAWRRAAQALERAQRAEAAAERNELLAARPDGEFYAHIAATHRRTAACHRSSARLQEAFARRTAAWAQGQGQGGQPRFMTGVAEACGTDSAALTLVDSEQNQLAVAASDEPSRAAQDLEYVLGEGPCRDAAFERRPIHASGTAIGARWPGYGIALASLGVTSVIAVPLQTQESCIGALAVFGPRPGRGGSSGLDEVAAALTRIVLLGPDADPELYGGTDHRETVQQAVGILSVRIGCAIDDALALIKARAFAEETSTEVIARRIVHGELNLG